MSAGIIYANVAASNENIDQDGTSCAKAFASLCDALDVASDKTSIWLAKSTYYPSKTNDTFVVVIIQRMVSKAQKNPKTRN